MIYHLAEASKQPVWAFWVQPIATVVAAAGIGVILQIWNARKLQRKAQLAERASDRDERLQDAYKTFLAPLFDRVLISSEYVRLAHEKANNIGVNVDEKGCVRVEAKAGNPAYDKMMSDNIQITSAVHCGFSLLLLLERHQDRLKRARRLFQEIAYKELADIYAGRADIWSRCIEFAQDIGVELANQYDYEATMADKGERPFQTQVAKADGFTSRALPQSGMALGGIADNVER